MIPPLRPLSDTVLIRAWPALVPVHVSGVAEFTKMSEPVGLAGVTTTYRFVAATR